jgi:hypothetical protein
MALRLKAIFQPGAQYEGVRPIHIYLLRLVYILMFFVLGKDTWTHILTHRGSWEPRDATDKLAGSPAEGTTSAFLWVILPIVVVPWGYVVVNYMYKPAR